MLWHLAALMRRQTLSRLLLSELKCLFLSSLGEKKSGSLNIKHWPLDAEVSSVSAVNRFNPGYLFPSQKHAFLDFDLLLCPVMDWTHVTLWGDEAGPIMDGWTSDSQNHIYRHVVIRDDAGLNISCSDCCGEESRLWVLQDEGAHGSTPCLLRRLKAVHAFTTGACKSRQ